MCVFLLFYLSWNKLSAFISAPTVELMNVDTDTGDQKALMVLGGMRQPRGVEEEEEKEEEEEEVQGEGLISGDQHWGSLHGTCMWFREDQTTAANDGRSPHVVARLVTSLNQSLSPLPLLLAVALFTYSMISKLLQWIFLQGDDAITALQCVLGKRRSELLSYILSYFYN